MFEEKEWKGNWFLPEFPENKVPGTLKYIPGKGSTLELIGASFHHQKDYDIILGDVPHNNEITLLKSFSNGLRHLPNPKFYVNSFLVGHHFYKKEDLVFNSLTVSSSQFDEWFHVDSLESSNKLNDEGQRESVNFSYSYKEPISFKIGEKIDGKIRTYLNQRPGFADVLTLREHSKLEIDSEETFDVFELEKLGRSFIHFIQLCSYEVVFFDEMIFKSNKILIKRYNEEVPKEIEFYRKQIYIDRDFRAKYHFDDLTNYHQLKEDFIPLIENWFAHRYKLEPITNILVYDHEPKVWSENDFLNMAQGLDSFHKRFRPFEERDFLNSRDKKIYDKIIELINNQNYERWLAKFFEKKRILTTYKDRIKELIYEFDDDLMKSFSNDRDSFIEVITTNRHYYSHLDIDKENDIVDNRGLFVLYVKLRVILTILVFKEIGLSEKQMMFVTDRLFYQNSAIIRKE